MAVIRGNSAHGANVGFDIGGPLDGWVVEDNQAVDCGTGFIIRSDPEAVPPELIEEFKLALKSGRPDGVIIDSFKPRFSLFGFDLSKALSGGASLAKIAEVLHRWPGM